MRRKNLSILILFVVALFVAAIGVNNVRADGASDYTTYCQMCHGPLASSNIKGTTVAAVKAAVTAFGMANTVSLTDAQIQAILGAVHGTPTPIPTPIPTPMPTVTPPPTSSGMQMPAGKKLFPYPPIATSVTSMDPAQAMPISVGAVAQGGKHTYRAGDPGSVPESYGCLCCFRYFYRTGQAFCPWVRQFGTCAFIL